MTVQLAYREVAHAKLEARLFLKPTRTLFTTRDDDTTWSRWMNTWSTANAYFTGLLVPGGKNMERIARAADVPVDAVERFIRDSPWEHAQVQAHLVTHIPVEIQDPHAAIVVDDFGIVKRGDHSVGVQVQYSGTIGFPGNCQVAVNVTYAAPGSKRNADQKTWPLGTEVYLPKPLLESEDHDELRQEVHLPPGIQFRTKQEIAWTMLERVYDAGVPHAVTVADAAYGVDANLRRRLRERHEPYVVGVKPAQHLKVIDGDVPVEANRFGILHYPEGTRVEAPKQIAQRVKSWKEVEWTRGTKKPLVGKFARFKIRVCEGYRGHRRATDEVAWLLLGQRSDALKAYLCWGLDEATLDELVGYAHLRWTIEQFHKEAKQYLGIDRFEGRTWKGWHHHVTLVLLAYAFLAWIRTQHQRLEGPLPTRPETARAVGVARITWDLMHDQGLRKANARTVAAMMVRRYTEW